MDEFLGTTLKPWWGILPGILLVQDFNLVFPAEVEERGCTGGKSVNTMRGIPLSPVARRE